MGKDSRRDEKGREVGTKLSSIFKNRCSDVQLAIKHFIHIFFSIYLLFVFPIRTLSPSIILYSKRNTDSNCYFDPVANQLPIC